MKTLVSIFVAFSVLFTTSVVNKAWGGHEDLFSAAQSSAWAIYTRSTGGMSATCSAIAVKSDEEKTYLLSAAHCFLGNDLKRTDFLVTQNHRTFYRANLFKSGLALKKGMKQTSTDLDDFNGNDWAVVIAEVPNMPVMPIGNSNKLSLGEDILMVGVPFGLDFLAVQGIVGSKDVSLSTLIWNHYYGGNIYVAGGNSGGGVISAKQKAVVGLVCAGPGVQSSMLIFMPISILPNDYLEPPPKGE